MVRIRSHDTPNVQIYDHDTNGRISFRESVIGRIKKRVGGFALVDPDIAFESPATGPPPLKEALQKELAEFRETERSLSISD